METDVAREDCKEYTIEKIIKHKKDKSGTYYLVKWEGYPPYDNTWEPECHINSEEILKDYWDNLKSCKLSNDYLSLIIHNPYSSLTNWDPYIREISTVELVNNRLLVYITWKTGFTSIHKSEEVNRKCPQLMIKFYESKLVAQNIPPSN